ncbi:MAG: phosphoenolpyruvate kinase, partial [Elusimicrobia bacterium]|nr:phosphoenolpyruvate kinase [Elusimicrobiota bacterium]
MPTARTTLTPETLAPILGALDDAEADLEAEAAPAGRRPVHVLYGGAHLFKADSAAKLGGLARKALEARLPDAAAL